MAGGTYNQKDMQTISDGVLEGVGRMGELPAHVQSALVDYWMEQGVDMTDPNSDTTQAQLNALAQKRAEAKAGPTPWLFKPIEWVGSKLYQLYSATVSPFVSATGLAAHDLIYGRPDYIGEDGEWDAFKDYWNLSHNISPGQSIWMLGLNNKELNDRGISPDMIARETKEIEKGVLGGSPLNVKTAADEYFSSGAAKWVTGATDIAVSWWADPLVLAGKGISTLKVAGFTKPVAPMVKGAVGEAKKAGVSPIDIVAEKPVFQRMVDHVMQVKTANPDSAALILRDRMPTLKKSANGDTLARLLDQAKDADEVTDVLRISIGDVAAKDALEMRNAVLKMQIDGATQRYSILGAHYDSLDDVSKASTHGQRVKGLLDDESRKIAKADAQSRIVSDKIDSFASLDNLNFNRITTPLGMKIRGSTAFQEANWAKVTGSGFIRGTGNLIYNSAVAFPIKLVRTYSDIKPSYYIDVHAEHGYKELDAALRENKNISREMREEWVSRYINSSPNDRPLTLTKIENAIASDVIKRYNKKHGTSLDVAMGRELYAEVARMRRNAQAETAARQSYGSATVTDPATGLSVRAAAIDSDGSRLVPTPMFETQMANHHVLMDFELFEKAVFQNANNWGKMRLKYGVGWAHTKKVADELTTYWKFAQLFRLGYAPRALADDFLGQVARFGGAAMAFRVASGSRVAMQDMFNATIRGDKTAQLRTDLAIKETQLENMSKMESNLKARILKGKARGQNVAHLERDRADKLRDIEAVRQEHASLSQIAAKGAQNKDVRIGREVFSPYFGGTEGKLFADLSGGGRNMFNLMGTQTDWYLKEVRRKDWEFISPEIHGAEKHLQAWNRIISRQIAQSAIGRLAMEGRSEAYIANWMRNTAEGRRYAHDVKPSQRSFDEQARMVKAEVDHVMDPALPGMDAIRAAALKGEDVGNLLKQTPLGNRPMVNGETWRYAEGTSEIATLMNSGINSFYKWMNQLPAQKFLRHPLFGQSYKAHLSDQLQILKAQGVTHIDNSTRKTMEQNARKGALDDVKKFTFTLDTETKMAYMLRNFGAFFGAQQESWNRWARIISDKPQTLPHIAQVYNAPARAGITVDKDGNAVDGAGYVTDPVTGERKLTSITERRMLVQIPEYLGGKALNKFLGLDEDADLVVPMSSVELVMNNGDGYLPVGAGPYVQMAVNDIPMTEWDATGKPRIADWAKKLGVLPFGPQESAWDFINPTTGKRLGDSMDDMGATKQRNLAYMMQVEDLKFSLGLRKTEPTWEELEDRASRWSIFRTVAAFTLPVSVNGQDPYQFFRDEFQRMQKLDPESADEKFHNKYGDAFYSFSLSMSKNNSGLRPTAESVEMSQYYQDLVSELGQEWAGAIVGAEGEGEFSEGAFFYQKTHSSDPASNTPDRSNLSAREAWNRVQEGLGWRRYSSIMDNINAQLFERGLKSYRDAGAEDLAGMRKAVVMLLTEKEIGGEENEFYNEQWTKAFKTMDRSKYDMHAQKWSAIVSDPVIWAKAQMPDGTVGQRSDVYSMKTYLFYRAQMQGTLEQRNLEGGSDDINAKSNYDLKTSWDNMVLSLIEQDTKFAYQHRRYFATDMGFTLDSQVDEEKRDSVLFGDASIVGEMAAPTGAGNEMMSILSSEGV